MQKLTIAIPATVVAPGATTRIADIQIPEEVIVKRFVVNLMTLSSTTFVDGNFLAALTQSDSNNPDANDPTDPNRLIRASCGTASTPVNLDNTITMRKLAGSGVHLFVHNLSASSDSYAGQLTLHYLEV